MSKSLKVLATNLVCAFLVMGCGGPGGDAPKLAPVTGTVTYKGGPIAGATVTFMPEKGPLAMAVTDLKGEFKLNTGTLPGCTVGPVKAAVTAVSPGETAGGSSAIPKTPEEAAAATTKYQADQAQGGPAQRKSLIPQQYGDVATSGLSFTVDADGSKNNFKIDLKD